MTLRLFSSSSLGVQNLSISVAVLENGMQGLLANFTRMLRICFSFHYSKVNVTELYLYHFKSMFNLIIPNMIELTKSTEELNFRAIIFEIVLKCSPVIFIKHKPSIETGRKFNRKKSNWKRLLYSLINMLI